MYRATRWKRVLLGVAALYAFLTLAYMLYNAYINPLGNFDFHLFWYNGHFLWEGRDPYTAYALGQRPTSPIEYLDGVTVNGDPAQSQLHTIPTNSPPLFFLLMPLAKFSWLSAKAIWLALNTLFMLAAPWLTLAAAARYGITLARGQQWALAIAFWAIAAPRYVVGYGQPSLLLYDAMLLALILWRQRPVLAGLWLGLALSKISLAFPLLLLALWQRRWKIALAALGVQAGGVLLLAAISGTPPLTIVGYAVENALAHAATAGIHVGSLYNRSALFRLAAPLLLTLLVGAMLWRDGTLQYKREESTIHRTENFSFIAIVLLWGLLVVYHRMYDAILLLPTLLYLTWRADSLPPEGARALRLYGIAVVTLMALPVPLYGWLFGDNWQKYFNTLWTLLLCSVLVVTLWLRSAPYQREAARAAVAAPDAA